MTDISYNVVSERGSLSPFPQSSNLDINRGYTQNTVPELFLHSSPARKMIFHQSGGQENGRPLGSPPLTYTDDFTETDSNFDGQSPAPFTAPPSPALSLLGGPDFGRSPKTSQQATLDLNQEPIHALGSLSPPVPPPFPRQDSATQPGIRTNLSRTRYRQQEENEHRQRLDALILQYGPKRKVTLYFPILVLSPSAHIYSMYSQSSP